MNADWDRRFEMSLCEECNAEAVKVVRLNHPANAEWQQHTRVVFACGRSTVIRWTLRPSFRQLGFDDHVECPNKKSRDSVASLRQELTEARRAQETEMLRVKACEHIAEGDEGWEKLRND